MLKFKTCIVSLLCFSLVLANSIATYAEKITLDRGQTIKRNYTLEVDEPPTINGFISIEPSILELKRNDDEGENVYTGHFTITIDGARLGNYGYFHLDAPDFELKNENGKTESAHIVWPITDIRNGSNIPTSEGSYIYSDTVEDGKRSDIDLDYLPYIKATLTEEGEYSGTCTINVSLMESEN